MPSVLSLDCSSFVGWAFFRSADDRTPHCRTKPFPDCWLDDAYGKYFSEVEEWLLGMLMTYQPEIVVFESPVLVSRRENRGTDEQNVRRLVGVVSVIEKVAYQRMVRCIEVHNQTAKAFMDVAGRRRQDETQAQYKSRMVAAVTAMGFDVADDHQADAVACALCVYSDLGEGV